MVLIQLIIDKKVELCIIIDIFGKYKLVDQIGKPIFD